MALRTYLLIVPLFVSCLSGMAGCSAPVMRDIPMLSPEDPHFSIKHEYPVRSGEFRRTISHLLGPPIVDGNHIDTLLNGDQIFPAMLEAIKGARESITFETYVYWGGDIGKQFADALSERARAGVEVRAIIDWLGAMYIDDSYLKEMKDAGVDINLYHKVRWFNPFRWKEILDIENRTHRKILVVDGKIGFTGGVGIADEWAGNAESPEHWRDTHYRITGPVVLQLQSAFLDNWLEIGGQVLQGDKYFPEVRAMGHEPAQAFKGSPLEATQDVELMYRLAFAAAEHSIKITNAYFLPDDGTIKALKQAARRGVEIEIIVPGKHLDTKGVKTASPGLWGKLLKAGIKIYQYEPTMIHCKVLVVDDYFSSIGSTNFDNRSFRLNDEVNVNVLSEEFSRKQSRIFDEDRKHSKQVTYDDWKHRPLHQKILSWFALRFRREL